MTNTGSHPVGLAGFTGETHPSAMVAAAGPNGINASDVAERRIRGKQHIEGNHHGNK